MKNLVIGINLFGHDTGAFTIYNGDVYAVNEERFTRIKHDWIFLVNSIKWILNSIDSIQRAGFDQIVFAIATKTFEYYKINEAFYKNELHLRRKCSLKLKRQVYLNDILNYNLSTTDKLFDFYIVSNFLKRKLGFSKNKLIGDIFISEIKNILSKEINVVKIL